MSDVESDGWISMVLLFLLLSYLLLSRFLILLVYKQAKYYSPTAMNKWRETCILCPNFYACQA